MIEPFKIKIVDQPGFIKTMAFKYIFGSFHKYILKFLTNT